MPRDWQDASQAFLKSSVSGASWNTVTLESISHYPSVNSLFNRYILKPLNLYAQSGPHPHVADSRHIPSSQLALTTQWKANQLGLWFPQCSKGKQWLFLRLYLGLCHDFSPSPVCSKNQWQEWVQSREAPGDGVTQGSLASHISWGHKELETTEQLNDNEESESVSCSVVSDLFQSQASAGQAPQSMELSQQGYWSGLSFPSPGDLLDTGVDWTWVSCIAGRFFTIWATREAPIKKREVNSTWLELKNMNSFQEVGSNKGSLYRLENYAQYFVITYNRI